MSQLQWDQGSLLKLNLYQNLRNQLTFPSLLLLLQLINQLQLSQPHHLILSHYRLEEMMTASRLDNNLNLPKRTKNLLSLRSLPLLRARLHQNQLRQPLLSQLRSNQQNQLHHQQKQVTLREMTRASLRTRSMVMDHSKDHMQKSLLQM